LIWQGSKHCAEDWPKTDPAGQAGPHRGRTRRKGVIIIAGSKLDCVIVGFNDYDLQAIMAAREKTAGFSGAFRQMLGSVFRHGGRWLHHVEFLNAVLREATGQTYRLHPMELPNLAIAYLKSYLTRQGLDVEIVNFFNTGKDRLAALLRDGPRAVAITTTLYVESDPIVEIVRFIREHNAETTIIAGGPYFLNICSSPRLLAQELLLRGIGADIYVHEAQGEATLARLLHALRDPHGPDLGSIPNLIYRANLAAKPSRAAPAEEGAPPETSSGAEFVRTPRQAEDNDLDACAVDWRLLPRDLCAPTAQMILSRSCPFHCAFCRYPALAGPWKVAGVATAERQMQQLRDAGARVLILYDDTPNIPLPRFKQMLAMMIRNRFGFSWFSNFRCANADAETYDLMQASGCTGVFLGIESGDETILSNMNKKASLDKYREGIARLKRNQILTYASFILGFPGETGETVERTARFLEETQPDYYQLHVYYHSKSVPIQLEAARFGLTGSDYSWRHATMDWQEACDAADRLRRSIQGPVIGTSYLSTFWMIGYLLGKGIRMPHIRRFMELCRPVLLRNAGARNRADIREEPLAPELLSAARQIAADMDLAQAAPAETHLLA
jgi:radical SAM PhpK family P-methyltransferase